MRKRKVLDKGFVKFDDVSGNDFTIINTLVVISQEDNEVKITPQKQMIEEMLTNGVMRAFEQITFRFHIKAPKFLSSNWFKMGLGKFSEAGHLSNVQDEYYIPSKFYLFNGKEFSDHDQNLLATKFENYLTWSKNFCRKLTEQGMIDYQQHMLQPQTLYTQFYWSVNAKELMEWLRKIIKTSGVPEEHEYAKAIYEIFAEKLPWTAEVFTNKELK